MTWSLVRRLCVTAALLLLVPVFVSSSEAQESTSEEIVPAPENAGEHELPPSHSAIINNGTVKIGVLDQGHLGVCCEFPSMGGGSTTVVGLRYMHSNPSAPANNGREGEATAPGCVCEGWGVADATTGQFGQADVAVGGVQNLAFNSFSATADTAVSVVTAFGRLRVTHDFHPSPVTPNLYEVLVTIENISPTAIGDLRYTRAMDWDIAPFTFSEFVTIQGFGSAANLLRAHDDGFEPPNPLYPFRNGILFNGNAIDSGPADHGALFDFQFGPLAAGDRMSFRIFYGAAGNEVAALNALSAVGAEAYSLGQPRTAGGAPTDVPHTFIFGFTGVGGEPIVPPAITLSPVTAENEVGTKHALIATVKDKDGKPLPDIEVTFTVLSGPNAGVLGVATTDASGQAMLGYISAVTGIDTIQASFTDSKSGLLISNTVTKEWVGPRNRPPSVSLSPSSSEFYEGDPGVALTATASDPDEDELVVEWTLVGPGSLSTAGFMATYTNPEGPALATVSVKVTDPSGEYATASASVAVHNVAPTMTLTSAEIDEGGTAVLTLTVTDPGVLDTQTVAIDWNDGEASPTVVTFTGGGTTTVSHTYADDHPTGTPFDVYTVNGGVSDDDGGAGAAVALVKVNNVAPVLGAITAPATPQAVGSPVTISASVSDVGAEDTHTCTVDWGDMTTSDGVIGGGTCDATHTFTDAGVYTLTMTVVDDDTGAATSTFQYVVVYDPSAGFVTGGGWINSPAGAYAPDPTLTGRANFGFVAKYRRGATTPDGQTEFQFKAGNLNFHSTEYAWLVVAGDKAQYKGSGQINGAGDYGFMLTLVDGGTGPSAVDKFRIRIFDRVGGGLVYDNKQGEPEDLSGDPQAIAGGSIVIHR